MISWSATRRVIAAAALVVAATACAPEPSAPPSSDEPGCAPGALPTLAEGTLTFGTDQPVYPPWYLDDDPASGRGFESAVAYAVAERLGYPRENVSWVRVPFNAAIQPGPKSFDLDLNEFSITPERAQAVDFSAPYYDVKQAVVALRDSPAGNASSIADLEGVRLGAQVGSTSYQAIVDQIAPTTEPAVFNTNDDAKLALSNGQVDAIVVDLPTAFYITSAELEGATIVGQLPLGGGTPEQFGAVLDKDSPLTPCVSAAIEELRADGTLAAIEQQWLASAETAPELR
ncbi:MAG TPA: ABC transporter substrate-binding protein [Pseudonocardia sp.]|uniref:ABC transporter substrate-binding protein n=1 Tax=Pseudonocardia sp. TaxID=60912 RepID=UPI002B4ACCB8|nr:ABC transporter substrate-binding protein [Pseudonocardia sp.]HLU56237.1 ABC transporter substrate-binding protein [Pseudonocardia sp.]